MKKCCFVIFTLVFLFFIQGFAEDFQKVEVTVRVANIRATPDLGGEIVGKAKFGDIYIVVKVEGNWYKIDFPSEKKGAGNFGYIHKAITKLISSGIKSTPPPPPPKAKKIKKKTSKIVKEKPEKKSGFSVVRRKKHYQNQLFSGFYVKLGQMTSPKMDSFGEKWIADFGFDSPIGKYAAWGLEFQPYLRSLNADSIGFSSTWIVTNIFLNVKGGFNIGQLFEPLKLLTLYIGAGPGVELSYSTTDYQGITGSSFNTRFAWHIVYGVEVSLGKMDIIIEFQDNKVINPDVDPSTQSSKFFLFGIRF